MGRIAKALTVAAFLLLLTACNKPGEIDPNLHYVDVNTPGIIPGQTEEAVRHDGSDNWGIDPEDYGDLSDPSNMTRYMEDYYKAKSDYYANLPGISEEATSSEQTDGNDAVLIKPNFSTASTYTDEELLAVYGMADAYGFYDEQKRNIYSRTGQLVEEITDTYVEAVYNMSLTYGDADAEFSYDDRLESYWFAPNYVYSVASSYNGDLITKSQSPYATEFTSNALSYSYGTPYHEDYYNIIWKTDTQYICVNRFTNSISYSEV